MSDLQQTRKDPKFIASAILVAIIVIAGIVLAGVYALGGDDDPSSPSSSATPSNKPDSAASTCGLADGDQSVPTTAPSTTWYLNLDPPIQWAAGRRVK